MFPSLKQCFEVEHLHIIIKQFDITHTMTHTQNENLMKCNASENILRTNGSDN